MSVDEGPRSPNAANDAGPTLAVALRYTEDDAAPVVVASGRGHVADTIVSIASEAGVTIDENPALATALEHVPLDEPIPEALYIAVAEVIGWVLSHRNSAGQRSEHQGNAGS
ncbi:MAG: EscU/YscU/HrcU family type III secretion system export apparatus switch protein [Pseudomonadota bacterium]